MRKLLGRLFGTKPTAVPTTRVMVAAPTDESVVSAYRARHDAVAALVHHSAQLLSESGASAGDIAAVQRLSERLDAHHINLVFVGIWSSGKSTLINALLGEQRLPMDIDVESACIARLVSGDGQQMEVRFSDDRPGVTAPQSVENVRDFMTAKSGRNVETEIAEVVLTTPNRLCAEGAVLVDTPGVEDLNQQRADVTYRFVPQADVVIFLLNAAQAGQLSEITFLKKIVAQQVRDVCFVVNMIDGKDPAEVERVLASLRKKLEAVLADPKLFPVSALHALEAKLARVSGESLEDAKSRLPALRTSDAEDWESVLAASGVPALERFMAGQFATATRSAKQLRDALDRVSRYVDAELARQGAARVAAQMSLTELRTMRSELERARDDRSAYFDRAKRELNELEAALGRASDEALGEQEAAKLKGELETLIRSTSANTWASSVGPRVELDLLSRTERLARAMSRAADDTIRSLDSDLRSAFEEFGQLARIGDGVRLQVTSRPPEYVGPRSTSELANVGGALTNAAAGGALLGGTAALVTVATAAITGPLFPLVALAVGVIGGLGLGLKETAKEDVSRAVAATSLQVDRLFDEARAQAAEVARDTTARARKAVIDDLEEHYKQLLSQCDSELEQSDRDLSGMDAREARAAHWIMELSGFRSRLSTEHDRLAEPGERDD